jgi:hypothetical protein
MQYALAVALVDGAVDLRSFEDDMVRRADVQALLPRLDVRPFAPDSPEAAGGMAGGDGEVRVVVDTHDGRRFLGSLFSRRSCGTLEYTDTLPHGLFGLRVQLILGVVAEGMRDCDDRVVGQSEAPRHDPDREDEAIRHDGGCRDAELLR